ncbi:interleukin-1 receptor-associated kinase 1-binding protein 1 homolog [Aplochiton taeniatus]
MDSGPTRVFAALKSSAGNLIQPYFDVNETYHAGNTQRILQEESNIRNSSRQIQVAGIAEVSCQADLATVCISVSSNKESVNDVTNSISRRLEYILQTVRQHDVKDENTTVLKQLQRVDELYHMEVEVKVIFSDLVRMERLCNVLLEKLDRSVCVGTPQFYHSPECLSQQRRRACVSAVENARAKASDVSSLLGQSLGHPLLVKEEEAREWTSEERGEEGPNVTHRRPPHRPTITALSRVSVSFSLRPRERTRKKL